MIMCRMHLLPKTRPQRCVQAAERDLLVVYPLIDICDFTLFALFCCCCFSACVGVCQKRGSG